MSYLRDPVTMRIVKKTNNVERPSRASPASPALTARGVLRAAPSCAHCGVTESRLWRTGPLGRRTLCDECGIRWKEGKEPLPRRDAVASMHADEEDDGDGRYEPPRPKRRKVSMAADGGYPADGSTNLDDGNGSSSGKTIDKQAITQAGKKITELEKACELLRDGLNNASPNVEQLLAVNQYVLIGLRNLKANAAKLAAAHD